MNKILRSLSPAIVITLLVVFSAQAHDTASLGYASMKTRMSKDTCKNRAYRSIVTEFKGGHINRHRHGVAYSSPRGRIEILCTTAGSGLVNYVAMVSMASNERRSFQIVNHIVKGISRGIFD